MMAKDGGRWLQLAAHAGHLTAPLGWLHEHEPRKHKHVHLVCARGLGLEEYTQRRRLFLVPNIRVLRLFTEPMGAEHRVVALQVWDGQIRRQIGVPATCQVVLALSAIASTRLALESSGDIAPLNGLMAHVRNNVTMRIRRKALGVNRMHILQTSAIHIAGQTSTGGRYHLQFYAGFQPGPNAEAVLYRMILDSESAQAQLANQDPERVAIAFRDTGEMVGRTDLSPGDPGASYINLSQDYDPFVHRAEAGFTPLFNRDALSSSMPSTSCHIRDSLARRWQWIEVRITSGIACNRKQRCPCTSYSSSRVWKWWVESFNLNHGRTDMTRYERIIQILDEAIGGPSVNIGVHGAFWRGLTRDQFVAKRVFNRDLVAVGNGSASNLVKALKGEAPFGADLPNPPPGAQFSRMPTGLPPVSDADIAFIQRWIDDGCPEDPFTPGHSNLRWQPTNAPVASSRTDDIWFLDPQVGWAVNSSGQIVHTTDGFNSWVEQLHDPEVYFRCVGFASATRGWAGTLTAGKTSFETRDGGQTWTRVTHLPPLAPPAICGLSVVNASVVFASGTNFPNRPPRMMKTLDGGQTWTAWDMRPWADILIDTYFTSPDRGWVVGGKTDQPVPRRDNVKPVVLFTEDGGRTWVNRVTNLQNEFPAGEWGWKIQFLNDEVGFVSLENFNTGAILKTTDGGLTWTRHVVNDPQQNANLEGVGFVDENHGWVGGWGDADFQRRSSSETFDGGLTWRDASEIGKALNRFRFFGNPVTVGYGSGETVYKYSSEPVPVAVAALAVTPRRGKVFDDLEPLEAVGQAGMTITVPANTSRLTVRIWDRFGDHVRKLVDETSPSSGSRTLVWDRTDDAGQTSPAGYFIWRATVDQMSESRLVLTK